MAETRYDIIVVGGGHAGIEAAHAAARLGCRTLMLTMDPAAIGRLSCNPAIGGLGKGHVVREIDALGGVMARATDAAGLQFRTLNRSKGPAVQAPRVQCDKDVYSATVSAWMARVPGLTVAAGTASEILHEGGRIRGLRTEDGSELRCRALILTTGTFLDSVMHCGLEQTEGGRLGERSAGRLSRSFMALGLETGRLKTGTPCRLIKSSIDFSRCQEQPGDEPPPAMSLRSGPIRSDQLPCHLTATTERTHEIIRANLDKSPMFLGRIEGIGPRYCPSIEDKVVRFEEKPSHHIFLEPETRHGDTVYPNGVSTSLPASVQEAFIRTVPGLENARFAKYGYAVEYTYVPPRQLRHTLEAKDVGGLFLAGQINGTSGYEEAAGQGLVAGINAAHLVLGREPFTLRRDEAYIAVMIDDLLTKDHREPYRLFTSRAEYRLLLRAENADIRLVDHAGRLGLIDSQEADRTRALAAAVRERTAHLRNTTFRTSDADWQGASHLHPPRPDKALTLAQYLSRRDTTLAMLHALVPNLAPQPGEEPRLWELVCNEVLYGAYVEKQEQLIRQTREAEELKLPADLDYTGMPSLRHEARMVLARFRPDTLGAAGRLAGVNPSDVTVLLLEMKKRERQAGTAHIAMPA